MSLVEEFCFELLSSSLRFAKRGYVTIVQSGTVSCIVLDLKLSSLSDALISELSDRDWGGVESVALSLYLCEAGSVALDILPTQQEIHPSSVAARITNLTSALIKADEESVSTVVLRVLHEAGPSFHAILIDAFSELVESRRLDSAKDLARAVMKSCFASASNDVHRWFESFLHILQEIFRSRNGGATLYIF